MIDLASLAYGPRTLPLLFAYGALTSIHCVGMCGGLVLAASGANGDVNAGRGARAVLRGALSYNAGRVISYVASGAIIGALGRLVSLPAPMKAAVPLIGGLFVILLGLNGLGFLKRLSLRFIAFPLSKLEALARHAFLLGFASALLPCGPLQAMQLYCLGSGGAAQGALAMSAFVLGTVPLLLAFGAASRVAGKRLNLFVSRVACLFMIALGFAMLSRSFALSGLQAKVVSYFDQGGKSVRAARRGDVQVAFTDFDPRGYPEIRLKAGLPFRWVIRMDKKYAGACAANIEIIDFKVSAEFSPGDNVIEFMPDRKGSFGYHSWCGMISNVIVVE
jgi:uncharacterized protein